MRRSVSTVREDQVPAVVVVGASRVLWEVCRQAVQYVAAATVEHCDLSSAATTVAKSRPFAIVIEEDLYAFDPGEFEALARDVHASVIRVGDPTESREQLFAFVLPRVRYAFRGREIC